MERGYEELKEWSCFNGGISFGKYCMFFRVLRIGGNGKRRRMAMYLASSLFAASNSEQKLW